MILNKNRQFFINDFLNKSESKVYLEIGVRNGENFFSIKSKNKIGVDPQYFFSKRHLIKSFTKFYNWRYKMYKKTSDVFFEEDAKKIFQSNKIDVVFIDGMHTYSQSLKDAKNSLKYLKENGVIIFHDCNPKSMEAAHPELPNKSINWNGDVWKTIYHFRTLVNNFECYTIDCDEGLGILNFTSPPDMNMVENLNIIDEINNLTYSDLDKYRMEYLGLKVL